MLLHLPHELVEAVALVIAGTLIMDLGKGPLKRVRLRAVSGEEQELKAGVGRQPALDGLGFVNAVVIHAYLDFREPGRWIESLQLVQQRADQGVSLAWARAMNQPSSAQ